MKRRKPSFPLAAGSLRPAADPIARQHLLRTPVQQVIAHPISSLKEYLPVLMVEVEHFFPERRFAWQ